MSRLILLCGVAFAFVAPVSWERLPDFKAVVVPPKPGDPPSEPGPGIDPKPGPAQPTIIRPNAEDPASTSRDFAYFDMFGDRPPYVSTCSPVPFLIRTDVAPANGDDLIFAALQRVANVTGLSFEFKGFTDDVYQFNERRTRYSWEDDRGPIWIGWATSDEVPDLGRKNDEGDYAVGLGGPVTVERGKGQREILGGGVVLRAGEGYPNTLGPGATEGNVLFHELGHALGLDHFESPNEQMNPSVSDEAPDGYGPGDRAGLQGLTTACSN